MWETRARQKESRSSSSFAGVILRREAIEVPAGKFNAWKIDYVLGPNLGTGYDLHTWFAPGIGFVKIVKWRQKNGPDDAVGEVLPEPIVYELSRIEPLSSAHPIDFPSSPAPLAKLPKHVVAPGGQVTLFADYGDLWRGKVVLYLVNRTADKVRFSEFGTLLETKDAGGRWSLAQRLPDFIDEEWYEIRPGQFALLLGSRSTTGEEREVRYRLRLAKVASNSGRGLVDPEELRLARFDDANLEVAEPGLVKEVLFGKIEIPSEKKDWARVQAIRRLGSLPSQEALPVLQRVMDSEALLEKHFNEVARVLARVDPARLPAWGAAIVARGPPGVRRELLRDWSSFEKVDTAELRTLLRRMLRDPKSADLRAIMSFLGSLQDPEASNQMEAIARNPEYADEIRVAAEYERADSFGTLILRYLTVKLPSNEERIAPPGPIVVTLQAGEAWTFDFSYDRPEEIVALFLEASPNGDPASRRFLKPKPGVTWFRRPAGLSTKVNLAQGKRYEVRMNLLDYFELPADYAPETWQLIIWPACSLPGHHEVPQVGMGVSVIIHRPR